MSFFLTPDSLFSLSPYPSLSLSLSHVNRSRSSTTHSRAAILCILNLTWIHDVRSRSHKVAGDETLRILLGEQAKGGAPGLSMQLVECVIGIQDAKVELCDTSAAEEGGA